MWICDFFFQSDSFSVSSSWPLGVSDCGGCRLIGKAFKMAFTAFLTSFPATELSSGAPGWPQVTDRGSSLLHELVGVCVRPRPLRASSLGLLTLSGRGTTFVLSLGLGGQSV